MLTRLSKLSPGDTAVITGVCCSGRISARLMELGLVPGEPIFVVRKAPFGDPVEYRVRGVRLTMRAAEAKCVHVETVEPASESVPSETATLAATA